MRARAVIGANFGDEGKGLTVDYLCAKGAGMVVRFNGGAQAGHTVVTPDGKRHVFQHFGSGTFCGVPTFLSQFFVCNPLLFLQELDALVKLGVTPTVYAHPTCIVSTFADMMINQAKEDKRGDARHGSVGLGVHETVVRSKVDELKITMSDLWNGTDLRSRLAEICDKYARFRTGEPIKDAEPMIEAFCGFAAKFAEAVGPLGMDQCEDPVFEGAQGLLLDQNNKAFHPHVTHSNTGMANVRALCAQAGIDRVDVHYVSRTYLTRHGAGPLPGENSGMSFEDKTNVDHAYQGRIRFAPLDTGLIDRCRADAAGEKFSLVLTHCDQLAPAINSDYRSFGETRKDVSLGSA